MRWTAPNFGIRTVILPVLALLMLAGAVAMVLSREPQSAAAADGPCGTSHDGLSSEESEFIDLLESWRAARHLQSSALESSAPLNAAAAWFAQHLVEEGVAGPTGHHDHFGRIWLQRAIDCGYNAYYAQGSGEGVGLFGSSALDPETLGAADGLALVDYPGSGININAGGTIPAKCVGVGVYRDEHTIAWIVIIAQWQVDLPCPQTVTAEQPSPNPSPSVSVSPTSTFTPSPTPTATPTPIPEWNAYAPNVASDR